MKWWQRWKKQWKECWRCAIFSHTPRGPIGEVMFDERRENWDRTLYRCGDCGKVLRFFHGDARQSGAWFEYISSVRYNEARETRRTG